MCVCARTRACRRGFLRSGKSKFTLVFSEVWLCKVKGVRARAHTHALSLVTEEGKKGYFN